MHLNAHIMEILSSRICHDLISPVGAISNGVELIEEFGIEDGDEAIELIASSATKASIHLRAFRWAYGSSGADSDVKPHDIKDICQKWVGLTRAELSWADSPILTATLPPRGMLKTLLNVVIAANEGLATGGHISVEVTDDPVLTFLVGVRGDRLTFKEGSLAAVQGTLAEDQCDTRNVHAYVTRCMADKYGFKLNYESAGDNAGLFTLSE